MLKNENIVCISSIDWDFVWQGHQEIMTTFARGGNRVLFIENTGVRIPTFRDMPRLKKRITNWFKSVKGFRQEAENLFVFSPIILPLPFSRIARCINRYTMIRPLDRWMKAMGFDKPIVWTFLPTLTALDIIDEADPELLVYYCIADFSQLTHNPKKVQKAERELIKRSDLIFAQGEALADKCRRLNPNVHIFPFGVKIETFEEFNKNRRAKSTGCLDITGIKKPVIGYIGGVHRHIDFQLLQFVARAHPEWSIAMIGPLQTDVSHLGVFKNIFFLGKKDFSSLPGYINEFDAAIIPYRITKYTETVYPTKLNEYHAMGKPVISTNLLEVKNFNAENGDLIYIANTYEEFTGHISRALQDKSSESVNLRISSAKKNSWSERIGRMSAIIEDSLRQKSAKPFDWRDNFLKFYRQSRRGIIKAGILAVAVYLLLFGTSFLWFAAAPLKISDSPRSVDAVVVFGGGVGETGSPGKSTIERARYAAQLYNEGYAKKIIFSSGYAYTTNDADNMRLIALSMGVSDRDIILEDKANSTYENVVFSKKILDRQNWGAILLVSSPYNMRRASLVFNSQVPKTKVFYAPVIRSQFYDRSSGVKLEQIRAVMHEYLGILYYIFKGYIRLW